MRVAWSASDRQAAPMRTRRTGLSTIQDEGDENRHRDAIAPKLGFRGSHDPLNLPHDPGWRC